jgi:glucose-1-phosphate thymidylyltransferase
MESTVTSRRYTARLSRSQCNVMHDSTIRRPVIGIVPAAGRATRLPERTGSKELIAVGDRAVSEHLIDAMRAAGADRIRIVIAPDKQDIVQFYGAGERHGVPVSYVYQHQPTGMSDAIDLAFESLAGTTVLMGMPDTIVRPHQSLHRVRALLEQEDCDIALAVAPTSEPCRLGPVTMAADGRVIEVLDKPLTAPHNHVWTVAAWGPRFTEFLHTHLATMPRQIAEAPLGLIFQDAIRQGFDVRALSFSDGCYIDAGTPEGLAAARRQVASETVRV